eukprot:259805-Pelagomonas_calceolata.AAC.3
MRPDLCVAHLSKTWGNPISVLGGMYVWLGQFQNKTKAGQAATTPFRLNDISNYRHGTGWFQYLNTV